MTIEISRHAVNTRGRDFVCGDLHGETERLWRRLKQLEFDTSRDRLFSVGDLIDRGRDSAGALGLLDQPWFYAVQGNHETMLIDATLYGQDLEQWHAIGGDWSRWVPPAWLRRQAARLEKLPHIMVVGEGAQRFNIVHAGMLDAAGLVLSDADVDDVLAPHRLEAEPLLWSRVLARDYWKILQGKAAAGPAWQAGLSLTFCGHTPVSVPGLYRSHYFLDGGAGYGADGLRSGEPFVVDAAALLRQLSA